MDFITGLPKSSKKNDSIMVVVDKLSKETHFIPVKSNYKAINIEKIFMKEYLIEMLSLLEIFGRIYLKGWIPN